jgi:general secretion pathway protein L
MRDAVRKFLSPIWRPVRWGLAALLAAHVVGLNAWALHQRATIADRRDAVLNVAKSTFRKVSETEIRRAPLLVLQREADAMRAAAGRPGETDFEPMLQAVALAWPADQPPVQNLRYENGRLSVSAAGWGQPQFDQFRDRLRASGWQAERGAEGRVTVSRAQTGAGS